MAAIQQQQRAQPYRYEPTLATLNAGQKELLFLPANEVAPPERMKYEFGMKNEYYHYNCARCPSCHLLSTKRIGLYARSLSLPPANGLLHSTQTYQPWVFVPLALDYLLVSSMEIPMCKLCPNCSQDQQLMSLVNHNCPTSNQECPFSPVRAADFMPITFASVLTLFSCKACKDLAICCQSYCRQPFPIVSWNRR